MQCESCTRMHFALGNGQQAETCHARSAIARLWDDPESRQSSMQLCGSPIGIAGQRPTFSEREPSGAGIWNRLTLRVFLYPRGYNLGMESTAHSSINIVSRLNAIRSIVSERIRRKQSKPCLSVAGRPMANRINEITRHHSRAMPAANEITRHHSRASRSRMRSLCRLTLL
jgi:hypothetical protein